MRRVLLLLAGLAAIGVAGLALMFAQARADPVVRRASVALPGWPAGAAPVRVALLSDLHLGDAATDATRANRIADQVSALRPDLILVAGDFLHGHEVESGARLAPALEAAMRRLHAPLGVVAVLGNHDYWTGPDATRRALRRASVVLLDNAAVRRGPLVIGGLDDDFTGHDRLAPTLAAMRGMPGARLMLAHTPDAAPRLPGDVTLLLAGHTHCGQIVLPIYGPPIDVSRHGARYRCGLIREGARTVVVSAGTGTSNLPLRLGAPPDVWLLTLGPVPSPPRP